ncbi:MAG: hypothetical protein ACI8YQ_004759 [Polaribacter sp.]|jgi:hypothetical protein
MILRTLIFFFELLRMSYWVYVVNILINKPRLRKEVESIYAKANVPFDPSYFHRIYFHLILSAVIVLWFSTLRGKWLSKKEQKAAVCLGAATPLYDDLYDELDMDRQEVQEMIQNGSGDKHGIIAILGMHFYNRLRPLLPNEERFNVCMENLAKAQEDSKAQAGGELSETIVREITYDKGGHSFAIYRSILGHEWQEGEEDMVYKLGSLIQLTSDIFDLRKDDLNKVQTLVTETEDINLIREEYLRLIDETIAATKKLSYNRLARKRFVMQLRLVTGRGMVCLDQLAKAQERHGGFDPAILERSESVCDMERVDNLLWSFWYALK